MTLFPTNPINALEASGLMPSATASVMRSFQLIQLTHWKREAIKSLSEGEKQRFQLIQLTHWKRENEEPEPGAPKLVSN